MRDPHGFRPLALGKLGDAWVVCSETCALDLINATYVRDVAPGEVVVIGRDGVRSFRRFRRASFRIAFRACLLRTSGQRGVRPECQRGPNNLDACLPAKPRCRRMWSCRFRTRVSAQPPVTPRRRKLPLRLGLIRNHYVGRTFIEPAQAIRHFGVKVKLNPVKSILAGQRVVLIDDSIVRGTTSRKIVRWCGPPVPARCTCASAVHRPFRRVFTEWTRRAAAS